MAVPKSYEDEIRDLLKGMDRFPGEGTPAKRTASRRWSMPSFGGLNPFGPLDARRIMGGALILMLFAWILRGPWSTGFGGLVTLAGYISLASLVLFVVAIVMLIRASGFGGGGYAPPQRWRGRAIDSRESRVIQMPRRGGLLDSWRRWWRTRSQSFARGPRRPGGRDSIQW